jgi:hypothetical protein
VGETLALHQTAEPGEHRSDQSPEQGDVLDRGAYRAGAPQGPGEHPAADDQELDAHQQEDIPGDIDRLVSVVLQEGGGGRDPQKKAEDGQTHGDQPLSAPERRAGQKRPHIRRLGLPAGGEPVAQAPASVQGRMGVRAFYGGRDAVQVDLAVAVDQRLADGGPFPQLLLVLIEVILEVDQVRDRPAVLQSRLRGAAIGFRAGGRIGFWVSGVHRQRSPFRDKGPGIGQA